MDMNKLLYIFMAFANMTFIEGFVAVGIDDWEYVKMNELPPARVEGRQFGEVVLICSASGIPTPSITWYKDGLPVSAKDDMPLTGMGETVAQLTLPCLSLEEAGKYECRATAAGKVVSSFTEVGVVEEEERKCGERIKGATIGGWVRTFMVEEGKTARLPCRINGDISDYTITWRDNKGEVIENNKNTVLVKENDSVKVVDSNGNSKDRMTVTDNGDLFVSSVNWNDMGQFSCTLSNEFGEDSVSTFLYPLAPGVR